MSNLRERLRISDARVREINDFLLDPNNEVVNAVLQLVEKFGGPEEINRKAEQARDLNRLIGRLKEKGSPHVKDLEWLTEQRDKGAFISVAGYRKKILGDKAATTRFNEDTAVTLEVNGRAGR
jgi:DNA-binding phage protein